MKKALLYIRVSTSRQDREGHSVPMQRERMVSFCKAKGWLISGVFVDPGFSGSKLDRPGINALIDAVKSKKGDIVLVYKLDRLSRSQRDVLYLLEDVFDPHGVAFVSMQESFDTGSVYGKAMLSILSAFSQMERSVIVERTMMGRVGRTQKGLWRGGGDWPIGYDYIDGALVVNPAEAEQVRMVYGYYADGLSVTEITRRMDGYQTKHGGWSNTSTVCNVLDNPLYAGTVHFDGVLGKGQHDAVVDAVVDRKVKAMRARLRHVEASLDSAFLLPGLMRCASCGARYFANKRPNGSVVYSCHSRAKKNRKMIKDPDCKSPHIPVDDLDAMVEAEILRLADDPDLVDEIIKKGADGGSGAAVKSEEVHRLDAEIGRLMDLLQHDALVSVGEIAERIEKAHAERLRLLPSSGEVVPRQYDVEGIKMLLRDIRFGWSRLDVRGRRAFLLQLIDEIRINAEGVRVVWSFE